ncbi:MAG TPA: pantoate--beta-alanine ligase [Dissulfurispiraceae bacterium]|nr:pantoate--beta-alanine ligase [Dissulfurispiraceae bacterium]
MEIIRVPRIMKETSKRLLAQGRSIGFVPTMGALHEGHLFLFKSARTENDIVVASIFVNPSQFGPGEDFEKYPRDMDSDMQKLKDAGVDILFCPDAASIYPEGFSTFVEVRGLSERLCGAFRPGHFRGVATVVSKLFNLALPTRAYFGQKDYQQAQIIRTMIRDLNIGVECVVCSTIRESNGLAMSSRNTYLTPAEREAAAILYKTLQSAALMIKDGSTPASVMEYLRTKLNTEPLVTEIQYAGMYDPETLEERTETGKTNLLAIAVKMGSTRLIDNLLVEM